MLISHQPNVFLVLQKGCAPRLITKIKIFAIKCKPSNSVTRTICLQSPNVHLSLTLRRCGGLSSQPTMSYCKLGEMMVAYRKSVSCVCGRWCVHACLMYIVCVCVWGVVLSIFFSLSLWREGCLHASLMCVAVRRGDVYVRVLMYLVCVCAAGGTLCIFVAYLIVSAHLASSSAASDSRRDLSSSCHSADLVL